MKAPAVVIEVVHDRPLIEQLSSALLLRAADEELIMADAVHAFTVLWLRRAPLRAPQPRIVVTGDQAPCSEAFMPPIASRSTRCFQPLCPARDGDDGARRRGARRVAA